MRRYLFDLHVHTAEVSACGHVRAADMVSLYKSAGYSGVVITDHYYDGFFDRTPGSWREKIDAFWSGFDTALEAGAKQDFAVLPGMEIRFTENSNDYLVFGLTRAFLYDHPQLYTMTAAQFYPFACANNLLFVQAHPYRRGMQVMPPSILHGIEVFNGNPRHDSRNELASLYADAHDLIRTSGSDFHQLEDLAHGGAYLPRLPASGAELVSMLRERSAVTLRCGKEDTSR